MRRKCGKEHTHRWDLAGAVGRAEIVVNQRVGFISIFIG
jgi:hypothetical protein